MHRTERLTNSEYFITIIWGVIVFLLSFFATLSAIGGNDRVAACYVVAIGVSASVLRTRLDYVMTLAAQSREIIEKEDKLQ